MYGTQTIIAPTAQTTPLMVDGAASQTQPLVQYRSSSQISLAQVSADGTFAGPVAVQGALPSSLLLSSSLTSGTKVISAPLLSYDTSVNTFGVAADTAFSNHVQVNDGGPGTMTYGLSPDIDNSVWNSSRFRIGIANMSLPSNEWGQVIQVGAYPTPAATPDYEKAGLIIMAASLDPSALHSHDIVGADIRAYIATGVMTGRGFGVNPWCYIQSGADGICNGGEIDLYNGGSNQPDTETTTSKTGLQFVMKPGSNRGTAAINIISGGTGAEWYKGIKTNQADLIDSFLEVDRTGGTTEVFYVAPNGKMRVGDLRNAANTGTYDATYYGIATFRSEISITDSLQTNANDNKHMLVLATLNGTSHVIGGGVYTGITTGGYPLSFQITPSGTATASEVMRMNIDGGIQFTYNASSAAVSAANTFSLANFNGTCKYSESGAAYANCFGGGASGGWTDGGANIYNTTQTDRVMVGLGSSMGDFSVSNYDGAIIANAQVYVTDGNVTNASLGGLVYDVANNIVILGAGRTGSGTYRNLVFQTNGSTGCTLNTSHQLACTSFSGNGASVTNINAATNLVGIAPIANGGTNASSQTSNAVAFYNGTSITTSSNLTYSSGSALNITSASFNSVTSGQGITFANNQSSWAGTASTVEGFIGASAKFRFDTNATNAVCVFIGGSYQRLGLSGSNVVVTGAC